MKTFKQLAESRYLEWAEHDKKEADKAHAAGDKLNYHSHMAQHHKMMLFHHGYWRRAGDAEQNKHLDHHQAEMKKHLAATKK